MIAGYLGGWVKELTLRLADVFYAFPSIILRDPPGGGAWRWRNLSTFLGHLLSFVVEFAGGVFSSWSGGLIQAVVGNAGGTGWWRTNRSGWAI